MNALVSVIIPVFNVEDYLDRCVESVIKQTYKNLEIIIVDDGSTDLSSLKCDKWAKKDSRIRLIHKNNEGVSVARNLGIDISCGEYLVFVDSDDYLPDNSIEVMIKRIQYDQSDLVVAQKIKVYSNGIKEAPLNIWDEGTVISSVNAMHMVGSKSTPFPASASGKLYKKSVFDDIRFEPIKSGEDTFILPHIVAKCRYISLSNEVVYFYFQRTTSVMHNLTRNMQLDNIRAVLHVARFLFDNGYEDEAKVYYQSAIIRTAQLKNDKEAKKLVYNTFDKNERRILKNIDIKFAASIILSRFQFINTIYSIIRK